MYLNQAHNGYLEVYLNLGWDRNRISRRFTDFRLHADCQGGLLDDTGCESPTRVLHFCNQ